MKSSERVHTPSEHNLTTLDVFDVGDKFVLEERSNHDTARHVVEIALCVFVGLLFLGSYLLLILHETPLVNAYPGVSLSMVLVGSAISLYAFATRGFKPQIGFDRAKKQFWVCKLNSKGHARIVTHFSKTEVQSIFVQRPETPLKNAALCARINGKFGPIMLLRGKLEDIEAAHRELCDVMRDAAIVRPVKPVVRVKFRGARPMRGFQASAA